MKQRTWWVGAVLFAALATAGGCNGKGENPPPPPPPPPPVAEGPIELKVSWDDAAQKTVVQAGDQSFQVDPKAEAPPDDLRTYLEDQRTQRVSAGRPAEVVLSWPTSMPKENLRPVIGAAVRAGFTKDDVKFQPVSGDAHHHDGGGEKPPEPPPGGDSGGGTPAGDGGGEPPAGGGSQPPE